MIRDPRRPIPDVVRESIDRLTPANLASCPRCRRLVLVERFPAFFGGIMVIDPFPEERWRLRSFLPLRLMVRQDFAPDAQVGRHQCPAGPERRQRFLWK